MTQNSALTPATIVAFLADIFERRGGEEYLGEPVTMAEHMLQAAYFAEQKNLAEPIIVAALLHDIGHFTSEFGMFSMADTEDRYHEQAGAVLLEQFFPSVVTDSIRHHVAAKRYLCATDPGYFAKLSSASIHSLNLQGGPMTSSEVANFQTLTNLEAIIEVRLLDDKGKMKGLKTPPFQHFAAMIQRLVDHHCQKAAPNAG